MSLLKIKIDKIIEKESSNIVFEGNYYGNHSFFSPRGFVAKYIGDKKLVEGGVYATCNIPGFEIISYGEGHEEIMKEFSKQLEEIIK